MYEFGWRQPSRNSILKTSASWLPYLWGNVNAEIMQKVTTPSKDEIVIS